MSFDLMKPVRVISGENSVSDNARLLRNFGKKCIIITSGSAAEKSGAKRDVISALEKEGIGYTVFGSVSENPKTSDCFDAGVSARDFGAEFVVGIGGGSPLDASKAVAVYASNPQISSPDLIYTETVENKPLPVVLVGTTAGTGSEVTGVSVLTNENGKKKSVKGENYYASLCLADYSYTSSMPYSVTVSTALDALCHAVESFLSNRADGESEGYAEKAVSLIWNGLLYLKNEKTLPSLKQRDFLYDGSIYAGLAIERTGTGFPHSVGYFLTERHSVPHGRACAVFLPEYVGRGLEFKKEKTERLLSLMNTDFGSFCQTVMSLADVKIDLDLKELEMYLPNWSKVANFDNSPGGFTSYEAEGLIKKLFL